MNRPRVSGWRLLLVAVCWPVFAILLYLAILGPLLIFDRPWARSHAADLTAIGLAGAYVALLVALMLWFGGPRGLRDRLGFQFTRWADLAAALGIWVLVVIAGAILEWLLTPLLGQPQSNSVPILKQSFDPLFVALVVPTITLLAPACEELLFRGALFGWLRGWLPWPLAGAASALVFAGAHLLPPLLPVLFLFGLAAAAVYQRTGSTLNSFAMHVSQNTLATIAAYLLIKSGLAG